MGSGPSHRGTCTWTGHSALDLPRYGADDPPCPLIHHKPELLLRVGLDLTQAGHRLCVSHYHPVTLADYSGSLSDKLIQLLGGISVSFPLADDEN